MGIDDLVHVAFLTTDVEAAPAIDGDVISVNEDQYGYAGANYELSTEGIANSFAIVAYNARLKVGLLANIPMDLHRKYRTSYVLTVVPSLSLQKSLGAEYVPGEFNAAVIGASYFSAGASRSDLSQARKIKLTYVSQLEAGLEARRFSVLKFPNLVADKDIVRKLKLNNADGELLVDGYDANSPDKGLLQKMTIDMSSGELRYIVPAVPYDAALA